VDTLQSLQTLLDQAEQLPDQPTNSHLEKVDEIIQRAKMIVQRVLRNPESLLRDLEQIDNQFDQVRVTLGTVVPKGAAYSPNIGQVIAQRAESQWRPGKSKLIALLRTVLDEITDPCAPF
jgi:hypothetical protein